MKPGQMQGSAKPVGKIRAGDTVVCNLENGYGGQPSPKLQERCIVAAFYSDHVILDGYPNLKLPLSTFHKSFNYIRVKPAIEDAEIVE